MPDTLPLPAPPTTPFVSSRGRLLVELPGGQLGGKMLGLGGTTCHVYTVNIYTFPEQRSIHVSQHTKLICAVGV